MCGQSEEWHRTHFARHPYTPDGASNELRDTSGDRKAIQDVADPVKRTTTPFDPVLRLALINAGVLTVEQIAAAEETIRVINNQISKVMGAESGEQHASVDEDSSAGKD
jgi:hypothetical protein